MHGSHACPAVPGVTTDVVVAVVFVDADRGGAPGVGADAGVPMCEGDAALPDATGVPWACGGWRLPAAVCSIEGEDWYSVTDGLVATPFTILPSTM